MRGLEEKVTAFIRAHGLFAQTGGVVLAVSGGADSIALLHVMCTLVSQNIVPVRLTVAHVNHQLRGAESDADQAFVIEQAASLNVPIIVKTVDVTNHAAAHGLSSETAARDLRLACLAEIAQANQWTWIATGHQKNDNAETLVQRLARGTGYRGLAGIRPWRPWQDGLKLASPLLDCTRAEILAYLDATSRQWRNDSSNADRRHRRNFIRHRLLPALQDRCDGCLAEELARLATSAQRLSQRITEQAERAIGQYVTRGHRETSIAAMPLVRLPEIVAVELIRSELDRLGCGQRDLTQHHYRSILELARTKIGRRRHALPDGFFACREGGRVILRKPSESLPDPELDRSIELSLPGMSRFGRFRIETRIVEGTAVDKVQIKSDRTPFLEYLDLDRLELPLGVRYRRDGDRFQPLGMSAEKKVGKFLTTAKVGGPQRRRVLVFHDRRHIVWLCPLRLGQRASVTPQTRRLLELSVTEETRNRIK